MADYPIFYDMPQRSPEWFAARRGKPSASQAHRLITASGERSKALDGYAKELAAEIMTGKSKFVPESYAMKRGKVLESRALSMFRRTDVRVSEVGLVERLGAACSPDGWLTSEGYGLEIKCPVPHNFDQLAEKGEIKSQWILQMQMSMWVCDTPAWQSVAYCPGCPLFLALIERNEKLMPAFEEAVEEINFTVDLLVGDREGVST